MVGRFVLDNSVVMAWCFSDETRPNTAAILDCLGAWEALVPAIWPLELGNVLAVAERKRRISGAEMARFLELVGQLPILVEAEPAERMLGAVLDLARRTGLSTYDASYLDLAMRLGLPLATQDVALIKAAKQAKVTLFRP